MNSNDKESIIKNLDRLVLSNKLLSETNHQVISVIEKDRKEKDELVSVCREVYQDLLKKEPRSLVEESWFVGLKNILKS